MKNKADQTIIILIILFILLGGISIFIGYLSTPDNFFQQYFASSPIDFSRINKDKIDQIKINHTDEEIVLTKGEKGWKVNHYQATNDVGGFLEKLSQSKVDKLVSQNSSSFEGLGLNQEQSYQLTLYEGEKEVFSLIAGQQAHTYQSLYVKKVDDDRVYLVYGDFRTYLLRSAEDWRNKQILSIDQNEIYSLYFNVANEVFEVKQTDQEWRVHQNEMMLSLDPDVLDEIFSSLKNLNALGFASKDELINFNDFHSSLIITTKNQQEAVLKEVIKEDKHYLMKEGDQTIYKISETTSKTIFPTLKELR